MKQNPDPRTAQFAATLVFSGVLLAVHVVAFFVGRYVLDLISPGYLTFVCILVPLAAVAVSLGLLSSGKWRWGQVVFVVLVALFLTIIQFLTIAFAGASV